MTRDEFILEAAEAFKAIGAAPWKVIETEGMYGAACTFRGEKYEMTFARSGSGLAMESVYRSHIVQSIRALGSNTQTTNEDEKENQ